MKNTWSFVAYTGLLFALASKGSLKEGIPGIDQLNPLSMNEYFPGDTILYPEESHFKNVQQLTFGGDNAEAYWSYDGNLPDKE